MGNTIPFFYYDIFARIVPGGLFVALLGLAGVSWPKTWADWLTWLHQGGTTQAIVLPLVYGGAAYVVGAVFDVLLAKRLMVFFRRGFEKAVLGYRWFTYVSVTNDNHWDVDTLAKWSYDCYFIRTTMDLPGELPHSIRFQAEAKCFFHSAVVLALIALAGVVSDLLKQSWLPSYSGGWNWVMLAIAVCLLFATASRGRRRANQILSFIDHYGEAKSDRQLNELQARLQDLQKQLRGERSGKLN